MRISRLVWDKWNEEYIAQHGVEAIEAEEIADGPLFITRARDGLFRVIGQSVAGRCYLTLYVPPRQGGAFYVVTARDATPRERRTFRQHIRRKA